MPTTDQTQGLVAFVRAVEAKSFSGAARLLSTTPSAISKSVARLEVRLGVRLFKRSTRALSLTDEGTAYFERISPLIRQIESAADSLVPSSEASGLLRVSIPAALSDYLVDAVTREFMPSFPTVHMQMSIADRHVDLLSEGHDLAIRAGELSDTGLTVRSAGTMALVLVASPAYLARHGRPRTTDELMTHSHIRYLLGGRAYPLILASGQQRTPRGSMDLDSSAAMLIAAVNGVGIAQMLRSAVAAALREGLLEEVLPALPAPRVPIRIVHTFGRQAPTRVRVFSDFILKKIAAF